MKKLFAFLWMLALLAMFVFSACSSNDQITDPSDPNEEEAFNLDLEYGGYSTGDESAAFGDTELMTDFPEDTDVSDAFETDAAVIDALNGDSTAFKTYIVRMTWGYLQGDSTETDITDWSGAAEVSKGTLVVLKKIRFEGTDFVHERISRPLVEFTSLTKTHFDGLLLAVIDNDTTDSQGELSISAGAFSQSFTFSELDSLNFLESVGDEGQEVSIMSHSREFTPFAGGFLSGRWVKTRPDGGLFKGRWINSLGSNAGFLHGIWGVNRFDNKVMKGKYISFDGEFRGLLAGQWTYDRNTRNTGIFSGHWANRGRRLVGTFRGHFKTGEPNDRRGFFHGRYQVRHRDRAEADPNRDGDRG